MVNWWGLGAWQALSFQAPVHFLPWLPCLGRRWRIRRSSKGRSQGSPSPSHQGSSSCLCGPDTLSEVAMCPIPGKNRRESVAVAGAAALQVHSLPLLSALVPGSTAAAEGKARCCCPSSPAAAGGRYSRQQGCHLAACRAAKEYFRSISSI